MSRLVVCFAGGIGSGKSLVSKKVAAALGWPRVSFGDYVRGVARQRGLDQTRETLQQVGAELVAGNVEDFCRGVLDHAEWSSGESLVVDGIRHLEVMDTLRSMTVPSVVVLVFVDVGRAERKRRVLERAIGDISFENAERHSTEIQVGGRLREAADIVIDGRQPVDVVVKDAVEFIRAQCHDD